MTMEKTKNSQIFSYVGAGLMLLTLLFPYLKVSVAFFSQGVGLLFDMGKLGDLNGLMYFISLLGIGVLAYCAYISIKVKNNYMNAAYAALAYFVVLFIMFFVLKGDIADQSGGYRSMVSGLIKMGIGLFMPLLAGGAYFMAGKAAIKEQEEASNEIPPIKQDEPKNDAPQNKEK